MLSGDPEIARALGARLKELRTRAGLTLQAVYERTEVTAKHVQLVERGRSYSKGGKPPNPRLSTLAILCDAYGTTVPQLMIDVFGAPPGIVVIDETTTHRSGSSEPS